MILDLNLILAIAAVLAATGSVIAVFAQKRTCSRYREAVETSHYHTRKLCEDRARELKSEIETEVKQALSGLEATMRAPEHAIAEGRMSRSSRSEALRLLRSGMAAETAAATLGMPKNDLELLSKISGILAAQ